MIKRIPRFMMQVSLNYKINKGRFSNVIILLQYILFIILFSQSQSVLAQETGKVEYPYLGISFEIPQNWKGQEFEGGYMMGSDTKAGLILLSTHESTDLIQLRNEARSGFQLGEGTYFQLMGDTENIGTVGIGGTFEGLMEWQQAKAFVIGLVNPLGKGVTILVITTPMIYDDSYRQLGLQVAKSIHFSSPKESPVVREWAQTLKGAKLTYMSSYGDSDYSGGYSGGSTTSEITLCSNQSFLYSYNSNFSMSTSGADAFSDNNDGGQGNWKVDTDATGEAILVLSFSDGREKSYDISYENEKTYLGGTRYFRTYDHGVCR